MEKRMRIVKISATLPDQQLSKNEPLKYVITKQVKHYTRAELAQKLKLTLRDIRNLQIVVSMIEPKQYSIIVSYGAINAIISSDSLYLLFENDDIEDFYQKFEVFFNQVLGLERQSLFEQSWELLCLETILYYQTGDLSKQYTRSQEQAKKSIKDAQTTVGQALLAQCQQELTQINTDCRRAAQTLERLLDNEKDVARLSFLNQKCAQQQERSNQYQASQFDVHTLPFHADQIADMVESYLFQIRALTLEAQESLNLITNKLELAELELDRNRNELMTFELKLTFLTAALDLLCMFAGLYGMNVAVPLDNTRGGFFITLAGICIITIIFYIILMIFERKLEKKGRG